jgi:hypothetical protein
MTTAAPSTSFFDRIHWLGSEIVLGTLIAALSVFTGVASYQGSMSDSDQNKYQNEGMQTLTDANAEYLTANQYIVYDYSLYDNWAVNEAGDKADYYKSSFSASLTDAMTVNPEDPFSDAYYVSMYKEAEEKSAASDAKFALAEQFNERGDKLQLVMLITAIGLAFAAWASLLNETSRMRLLFAALAVITTVLGILAYLTVPAVAV